MKRCSACGLTLAMDDFSRDASRADGRMIRCKSCDAARNVAYYEANRETVLARRAAKPRKSTRVPLPRQCVGCGMKTVYNSRHRYCAACRPAYLAKRKRSRGFTPLSAAERGYDAQHQKERRRVARLVESSGALCWRCGTWISPGEPWDLGHDDVDRSIYRGPEHRSCNRATAARHKRRSVPRVASRVW